MKNTPVFVNLQKRKSLPKLPQHARTSSYGGIPSSSSMRAITPKDTSNPFLKKIQTSASVRNGHAFRALIDTKPLIFRFSANHGNPELISCASISLMNAKKDVIQIRSISVEPKYQGSMDPNILRGRMSHSFWSSPFHSYPIDVKVEPLTDEPVKFIRVLNNRDQGDSAVSQCDVFVDNKLIWSQHIPQDFGVATPVMDVDEFTRQIDHGMTDPYVFRKHFCLRDNFGVYPQTNGMYIKIKLLDNYGDFQMVGFSRIAFYSTKNERIPNDSFECKVTNGEVLNGIDSALINDDEEDGGFNEDKMFTMQRSDYYNIPEISINFKQNVVSMITFINIESMDLISAGVKKIAIYTNNDDLIYAGKIRKGGKRTITKIYLNDMENSSYSFSSL